MKRRESTSVKMFLSHMQHDNRLDSSFSFLRAIIEVLKPPQTGPLSLIIHRHISQLDLTAAIKPRLSIYLRGRKKVLQQTHRSGNSASIFNKPTT